MNQNIIISGQNNEIQLTKLYQNNNEMNLAPMDRSSLDWGDYDQDGNIDLLISGCNHYSYGWCDSRITKIYKNINNTLTDSNISLPGVSDGRVKWIDANSDSYPDILITGDGIAKLYKNNQNGTFSNIETNIKGSYFSAISVCDFDNDGNKDLLLNGIDISNAPITFLYKNNGNETFTEIDSKISLTWHGDTACADYNNDGLIDFAISGFLSPNYYTTDIFKNLGNFDFEKIQTNLRGTAYGSLSWGDYDRDNKLDLLVTGLQGDTCNTKLYHNDSNDLFSEQEINLPQLRYSSSLMDDVDNDGEMEILLTGETCENELKTEIYKVAMPKPTSVPSVSQSPAPTSTVAPTATVAPTPIATLKSTISPTQKPTPTPSKKSNVARRGDCGRHHGANNHGHHYGANHPRRANCPENNRLPKGQ